MIATIATIASGFHMIATIAAIVALHATVIIAIMKPGFSFNS